MKHREGEALPKEASIPPAATERVGITMGLASDLIPAFQQPLWAGDKLQDIDGPRQFVGQPFNLNIITHLLPQCNDAGADFLDAL